MSWKCLLWHKHKAVFVFIINMMCFWSRSFAHSDVNVTLCALQAVCGASAVHLLADCSHRAAVAARLRSASRGSAAFGAEVGRMAEKQRRWTLHRGIPIYDVVK